MRLHDSNCNANVPAMLINASYVYFSPPCGFVPCIINLFLVYRYLVWREPVFCLPNTSKGERRPLDKQTVPIPRSLPPFFLPMFTSGFC
jgi:hypothetical protein